MCVPPVRASDSGKRWFPQHSSPVLDSGKRWFLYIFFAGFSQGFFPVTIVHQSRRFNWIDVGWISDKMRAISFVSLEAFFAEEISACSDWWYPAKVSSGDKVRDGWVVSSEWCFSGGLGWDLGTDPMKLFLWIHITRKDGGEGSWAVSSGETRDGFRFPAVPRWLGHDIVTDWRVVRNVGVDAF